MMKLLKFESNNSKYYFIAALFFLSTILEAQMFHSQAFYNNHDNYKERQLDNKRFNYNSLQEFLAQPLQSSKLNVKKIGESLEKRDINLISFGNGSTHVLAWSQMHGDESTATMALVDILNFLVADDEEFNNFRNQLSEILTVHFIPMLNPDGAERFQRRNALDIDLNRDALRLQYPESQALRLAQDSLKPLFGFNLHDQDLRYTAGKSYKSATLSFLAPAYNFEKDINEIRSNAMKVIVNITDEISNFIPGHIGRYSDDFEPRAFGDNFVKWGTGTILIESGGWKNNFEKQFLRKLNFVSILVGLESMANKFYLEADINKYGIIPENKKYLFDVLMTNLKREYNSNYYLTDIGINHTEKGSADSRDDYYFGYIDDLGDLSTFYGYEEFDCSGMVVKPGLVYPEVFPKMSDLKNFDIEKLYEQGFTTVIVEELPDSNINTEFPINIVSASSKFVNEIGLNKAANFVVFDSGKVRFVVINGFVVDVKSKKNSILNGIIYK